MSIDRDQQIIDLAESRMRRAKALIWVQGALAGVLGGIFGIFAAEDRLTPAIIWTLGMAFAVLLTAVTVLALQLRQPREAMLPRILAKRAGSIEATMLRTLGLMPWALGFEGIATAMATRALLQREDESIILWTHGVVLVAGFCIAGGMLIYLLNLGNHPKPQPALDDELLRNLRDRALKAGLVFALVGVAMAFALGLYAPEWALACLPPVIFGSVGLIAVRLHHLYKLVDLSG